jgi:tetratricopeptide (TPR) repeat protein
MGGFGLGLFRLGTGRTEKRSSSDSLLDQMYDSRLAFFLAYGRSLSRYDLGFALTIAHHSQNSYSALTSPGLNLSVSRRFAPRLNWLPEVSASVNGRNLIPPKIKLADESIKYPYSVDAGVSLKLTPNPQWDHGVTLSAKVTKAELLDPDVALGLEYIAQELFHLRCAVRENRFSFGCGLRFKSISLDYALVDRELGGPHVFSITADFGKPVSERKRIREKRLEALANHVMNRQLISLTDSLISCEKSDEALVVMRALSQISEYEDSWQWTPKEVEFEHFRETAVVAFSEAKYDSARAALDSALNRFPGHPWCLELRTEIDRELNRGKVGTTMSKELVTQPPSDELLNTVDETYEAGSKLFEEGKLPEAISRWEQVEKLVPDYIGVRERLVTAYKFLGIQLYGHNRFEEAVTVWKKAVKLAPDNSEIGGYIKRTENEIVKLQGLSDD